MSAGQRIEAAQLRLAAVNRQLILMLLWKNPTRSGLIEVREKMREAEAILTEVIGDGPQLEMVRAKQGD